MASNHITRNSKSTKTTTEIYYFWQFFDHFLVRDFFATYGKPALILIFIKKYFLPDGSFHKSPKRCFGFLLIRPDAQGFSFLKSTSWICTNFQEMFSFLSLIKWEEYVISINKFSFAELFIGKNKVDNTKLNDCPSGTTSLWIFKPKC